MPFCVPGKQAQNREGFLLVCSFDSHNGGSAGSRAGWRVYSTLSDEQKTNCGLCFDAGGTRFSLDDVAKATQHLFQGKPGPIKDLTSYSFRRLAPTMGHMLRLEPEELVALGDWQKKSEVAASKAAMPLHYSAARYAQLMRGKHRVLQLMDEVATYEAWELVPDDVLNAADLKAKKAVDQAVARDRHVAC